jgi:SOS-response transcriptional repressor LexA
LRILLHYRRKKRNMCTRIVATIARVDPAEKLKTARDVLEPKLTQAELGERIGIKPNIVRNWEMGRTALPKAQAMRIAEVYDIDWRWFFDSEDSLPKQLTNPAGSDMSNVGKPMFPVSHDTVQIPMWPAVPAGDWEAPSETIDFYDVDVRLFKRNRVACKIVGDSMHPYLQQGDIGVFELNEHPQIGLIVLARNGDAEATVKQLSYNESGYVLISLRDGEEVHASKWSVLGFLVARIRDLGPLCGSRRGFEVLKV